MPEHELVCRWEHVSGTDCVFGRSGQQEARDQEGAERDDPPRGGHDLTLWSRLEPRRPAPQPDPRGPAAEEEEEEGGEGVLQADLSEGQLQGHRLGQLDRGAPRVRRLRVSRSVLPPADGRDDAVQTRAHPDSAQHQGSQEGQHGVLRPHQTRSDHGHVPGERTAHYTIPVRGDEGGRVRLQVVEEKVYVFCFFNLNICKVACH